jgi:hypothetical protein
MIATKSISFLYTRAVKPLLFLLHPDRAHDLFIHIGSFIQWTKIGKLITRWTFAYSNPEQLGQTLHGIYFRNPIGLSAGFDKDAHLYDLMADVGFGFTQAGSITDQPYAGNPPPRGYRLLQSK